MRSRPPIVPPTLQQLRTSAPWIWVHCTNCFQCRHISALALAPLIIRWGPNASSDVLRQRARCSRCGHKGASLQTPSWCSLETGGWLHPCGPDYACRYLLRVRCYRRTGIHIAGTCAKDCLIPSSSKEVARLRSSLFGRGGIRKLRRSDSRRNDSCGKRGSSGALSGLPGCAFRGTD